MTLVKLMMLCVTGMKNSEGKELVDFYDVGKPDEWQKHINGYNERRAAAVNKIILQKRDWRQT